MRAISRDVEEWETPAALFAELDREFRFTLDAAATPANAKCRRFFTRETDALAHEWKGTVWCNPPYGRRVGDWVRKAFFSAHSGTTVVLLVPARTDSAWFHDLALVRGEVRFIRGRVHFLQPDGRTGRPRFASAIVIFRSEPRR